MSDGTSWTAAGRRLLRIDTWERVIAQLRLVRDATGEDERVDLVLVLLVNLRLLGQDPAIPDRRDAKGDIERIHAELERATREALDAAKEPSSRFVYYAREVVKKLPVRHGGEELIERIRADAEAFEEDRTDDDPLRGFAGDLRKEVHRRLSPRIVGAFLEPYLALAKRGDPEPIVRAGYVALPSRFDPDEESSSFVDLAERLLERLRYLWDYERGDLAEVRRELLGSIDLFERCFLRAEIEGFVELLTPERLGDPDLELDLLKRLSTFKRLLKDSLAEGRIGLYDLVMLDLTLGRAVFLLATDLANNQLAVVGPRRLREALDVVRELLAISTVKGFALSDVERQQAELEALRSADGLDYARARRCLEAVSGELQRYVQAEIIDRMSAVLNRVLGEYDAPTSRLSHIKTRFFNNFIRRTQIHVLSEFVEKVAQAVDSELARASAERSLFGNGVTAAGETPPAPAGCVARTWVPADPGLEPYLGGKGNGLLDMAALGLRVPEAFVLAYPFFRASGGNGADDGRGAPDATRGALILDAIDGLERACGLRLGDPDAPLLVSVRSGAAVSMPGVMATILNVGQTPDVRRALAETRGSAFADTVYARFLSNCAAAADPAPRPARARSGDATRGVRELEDLLTAAFGESFLADPREQILRCVALVRSSQDSRAARDYAATLASATLAETAVTVQRMVFGNLDAESLSGVVLTRNPITGADELFGEFKRRAQGEEVVMGSAGTEPISGIDGAVAAELERGKTALVARHKQDLDLEFTVEAGELFFLQARAARLGPFARLAADTDFLERGLIGLREYRERVARLGDAQPRIALPRGDFRVRRWNPPLATGVPIVGGVVSGVLVLGEDRLAEAESRREIAVLFAQSTKPTDFAAMDAAHAIVTVYPGRTSHAAIIAMSLNKTCVVGCSGADIDLENRTVAFRSGRAVVVREGDSITVDGNTGAVYRGAAPISECFLPLAAVAEAAATARDSDEAVRAVRRTIADGMDGLGRERSLERATLADAGSLAGKRVLLRADANVAVRDGAVLDRGRVMAIIPAVTAILERGGTPIICSHLGDPGLVREAPLSREEIYEAFSLRPVAAVLQEALGDRFAFLEASVGSSGLLVTKNDIVPGRAYLLENLRFALGERDNDEAFARALAALSDGVFVNDSFNVSQRRHASIVGVARFVERSLAGPQVTRELAALETLLEHPVRPFVAVFGGDELEAQFGVMTALLPRLDTLAALVRPGDTADSARLERGLRGTASGRVLLRGDPRADDAIAAAIDRAGTVLWSGPAPFLRDAADDATITLAAGRAVERGATVVVCSDTDKELAGRSPRNLHVSSGPRAFLVYLERLSLPGITPLDPA